MVQIWSTGSVKVAWLDRPAVIAATERAVAELTRTHPEVLRVYLFGSMQRGDAVPGSDVDLLIVVSHTDLPFLDRYNHYKPGGIPVSCDVFVYAQEELDRMIASRTGLVLSALQEGRVLFERT